MITNYTELIGKIFVSVENKNNEELVFTDIEGNKYKFYHDQDCCESVEIIDIIGNLDDLVGAPLIMAEEVIYDNENPEGIKAPDYQDYFQWTFYKFATIKGYVTVRWHGNSNGYYSISVDFRKVN